MNWIEAIKASKKGTANRVVEKNGKKYTFIMYKDGSCYRSVSYLDTGKHIWNESGEAQSFEYNGFSDWEPS
jgi:hypothetical protein